MLPAKIGFALHHPWPIPNLSIWTHHAASRGRDSDAHLHLSAAPRKITTLDEFVQPVSDSSDLLERQASRLQRAAGAQVFRTSSEICFSRFVLIAGGAPRSQQIT